nr:pentatricopeptide repeat (PPR) superfamily protein [Tanacetum cinerariifolium]
MMKAMSMTMSRRMVVSIQQSSIVKLRSSSQALPMFIEQSHDETFKRLKQPFILEESPIDTMADQRTMAELLRTPTKGIAKLTHAVNQQTSVVTTAMKAILKQFQATPPPASVKSIEEICVTCDGAHPYYQCLAAGGNTFPELQDNIQGYVSAAAINYNQGNFVYRPLSMANQIRPPGFAQPNAQNKQNQFGQPQGFNRGSGSLPSNTVANPKGELKAITTRSGLVLDGPTIPTPPPISLSIPSREFDTKALDTVSRIKSISISQSNSAKSGAFIFHKVAYTRVNVHRMDQWGDHAVHCSSEVGVKFRHNLMRDILVDKCSKVGIMVRKEALMGFLSDDEKDQRPADLLL